MKSIYSVLLFVTRYLQKIINFSNKVTGLCYAGGSRKLFSAGADGTVGCWDMTTRRKETPAWQESDTCHLCRKPFFWNIRAMMDQRQLGIELLINVCFEMFNSNK